MCLAKHAAVGRVITLIRATDRQGSKLACREVQRSRHKAEDIIYTDGSRSEFPKVGIVTGGGAHTKLAHAQIQHTVHKNTAGENNTIDRAEAASIHVTLQKCKPDHDEVIATNSKCSMYKIAKHMRDPALAESDIH